jgi:hypothetical protein
MKLTIEPTAVCFSASDVMVRMWQGTSDDGSPCIAMVTTIGFPGDAEVIANGLIADSLTSIPPPDAEAQQRWAHLIMDQAREDHPLVAVRDARGALDAIVLAALTKTQAYLFATAVASVDNLLAALV